MKNYFTNLYRFGLTILLLLVFSSGLVANINYPKLELAGNNIPAQLLQASAPTSFPSSGTYTGTQLVTITTASNGANIRYTTDGTDPSSTAGILYSGPISITANTILKSVAYGAGFTDSPIITENYFINCETPVLSPGTNTYNSGQRVTMTSATTGAKIYYTTNGTVPSAASTLYTSRITLTASSTLRAIAIMDGMGNSEITTETYNILLPVSQPIFTPAAGTYNAAQNVAIISATNGATIYYTTDGSTPTTSSKPYGGPIAVETNITIKAIAAKSGMADSPVSSADYVILLPAAQPTFTPPAGVYTAAQSVTIASATPDATIYYTTDGTTPTTSSAKYSAPITVSSTSTIKAIAGKSGMSNSQVTSGDYSILLPAAAPTFTPTSGNYTSAQNVTIATTTPGATIYYTTDGTAPTTSSQVYSSPVLINATSTIKAIVVKTGMSNSPVASAEYTLLLPVASPTFTPAAGTYSSAQKVTIASATPGVTIFYTTDGSIPTTASTQYTSPVNIEVNTALNAIAVKAGMSNSTLTSGNYVIQIPVAAPTFTPAAGTYTSAQSVSIASATPGATIYYTIDGTTPTSLSPVYNGPITISANATINAIAEKSGMSNSQVSSANYILSPPVASPNFTPAAGTYNSSQNVAIVSTTLGATIYYTTDGSTPSKTNGTVYAAPITISTSATVKAIAYATGLADSEITSATYSITPSNSDSDNDGISDTDDEYPNDPFRAANNPFPATGFGSLAFEDNWPLKADYDMNDMVIDYQFNQVTNAKNEVVEIKAKFVLRAIGTTSHNGFGIEFPVSPTQVSSCVVTLKNGNTVPFGNTVTINPVNGLESSNNPNAVVILFDDGFKLFPHSTPETFINTSPDIAWTNPDTLNMTLTFAQPVKMDVFMGSRVYNPFIFTNNTRSTEIHLPDYPPTSLANTNLFNTGEDNYNPSTGTYYKTAKNLPWALNIYEGYDYPVEKASIIDAFLHFADWAQSNGTLYPDWYKLQNGFRKINSVYNHP